jgi:serine phosphatase RsbU (regulator of sigma subunit)
MSVIGLNLLQDAVGDKNITQPAKILEHLDWGVNQTLRQEKEGNAKDGMDLSLCSLNPQTLELQYAGAYNSLYYITGGELKEIKADKSPIGVNTDGVVDNYTNHSVQLKKGDCVYLYSDGYADQFGGPKGKKFKYAKLRELLLSIHTKPMQEQHTLLLNTFGQWKGELEQIDDVCIIGVRV